MLQVIRAVVVPAEVHPDVEHAVSQQAAVVEVRVGRRRLPLDDQPQGLLLTLRERARIERVPRRLAIPLAVDLERLHLLGRHAADPKVEGRATIRQPRGRELLDQVRRASDLLSKIEREGERVDLAQVQVLVAAVLGERLKATVAGVGLFRLLLDQVLREEPPDDDLSKRHERLGPREPLRAALVRVARLDRHRRGARDGELTRRRRDEVVFFACLDDDEVSAFAQRRRGRRSAVAR